MRKALALVAGVCTLAVLATAQLAAADTGSISSTWSAAGVATCNGSTTVEVHVDATDPPAVQRPLDVAFVIDESGSISASNFNTVKTSVSNWASPQTFGPQAVGAAVVQFATSARLSVPMTFTKASFLSAVAGIYQNPGNTDLTDGLKLAQQELSAHGRAGVQKVIIVETDGQANVNVSQLLPTATTIKSSGTLILAIGVGSQIDQNQLNAVASSPSDVFLPNDYSALNAAFQSVETQINPAATDVAYTATAAAGWTVTGASSGVSFTPTGVSWTGGTLHTGGYDFSYTLQHTGTTGGTLAPQSQAALTWTDPTGAAQQTDYSGETVEVDGCNQPPVANAGPDQTVDLSGSHTADVTLDGSGSTDDGQVQPLAYTWAENGATIATGANPTVPLGLGVHDITLTVDDGQFQSTDDVVVTVVDPTPPVVVPTVSGTLGSNGWYVSDVDVSWSVTDAESDVTSSTGCDPSTVSSDTAGTSFTCTATSAGGTTAVASPSIERDATAPVVSYSGNAGSYGASDTVNITCSASDNLSGVASSTCADITGPAYQFAGSNTFSATATDNAGNSGSATVQFTVTVTSADVCALANQWVDQHGIANALCAKASHDSQNAFVNQVNAQRGKALSPEHADILIRLVKAL